MDKKLAKASFLQALGIFSYIAFIALFFWKGNELFGNAPNYLGPVLFLLLFSVSVLICGFLMFYKPFLLWDKGKSKDAVRLVAYSLGWLVLAFLLVFLVVLGIN